MRKRKTKNNSPWGVIGLLLVLFLMGVAACREDPSADLFLKAGDALREGKVDDALSLYSKAASLYPHSATSQEAFYWIGEIYRLFKQQPKDAIDSFRKSVAEGNLSPYGEKAQKSIAEIYLRELKDYNKAIPELQRLIDQYPASRFAAEVQYQIGQCYMAIKEYGQARIEYSLLLDRYAVSDFCDDAAYRICVSYERQGDFESAQEEYQRFITRYPDSSLVQYARLGLANSLEEQGRIDEAVGQLVSLEKEYPNHEIILRKLDSLLKKKNAMKKDMPKRRK